MNSAGPHGREDAVTADPRWKEEEKRQARELTEMFQNAIDEHGRMMREAGRPPIMNALAGALVTIQAGMLASIEDPRHRKALRKIMEKELPRALAEARIGGYAQTIVVGGPKH